MVLDGSLKLRQDDAQLSLTLGGDGLRAQVTDTIF